MRGEPGSKEGYALDKNHRVFAHRFDDFERYARVPDNYVPYEPPAYKPQVRRAARSATAGSAPTPHAPGGRAPAVPACTRKTAEAVMARA